MTTNTVRNQQGFTLIELMIALAVFSFMLTIIMVGFIGVVRTHEAGVVQRNTQQNARLAIDQVTKAVQQAATAEVTTGSVAVAPLNRLCLTSAGQRILLEVVDQTVSPTLSVKTLTTGAIPAKSTCSTVVPAVRTRLTDDNVTVTQFGVTLLPAKNYSLGAAGVTLSVASAFGQTDLDPLTLTSCKPGAGAQFCAVTTMQTTAAMKGGLEK